MATGPTGPWTPERRRWRKEGRRRQSSCSNLFRWKSALFGSSLANQTDILHGSDSSEYADILRVCLKCLSVRPNGLNDRRRSEERRTTTTTFNSVQGQRCIRVLSSCSSRGFFGKTTWMWITHSLVMLSGLEETGGLTLGRRRRTQCEHNRSLPSININKAHSTFTRAKCWRRFVDEWFTNPRATPKTPSRPSRRRSSRSHSRRAVKVDLEEN